MLSYRGSETIRDLTTVGYFVNYIIALNGFFYYYLCVCVVLFHQDIMQRGNSNFIYLFYAECVCEFVFLWYWRCSLSYGERIWKFNLRSNESLSERYVQFCLFLSR